MVDTHVSASGEPMSGLDVLLATGPFHSALRAAILARRLSLARISHRLAERGSPVSPATLSHWQSGRSQPERVVSFHALAHLEQILGVPSGALATLLEPPRPRGRRSCDPPLNFHEVFSRDALIAEAIRRFEYTGDRDLISLSFQDRVELGSDARVHRIWSRQVKRATADGPDRVLVLCGSDVGPTPALHALLGCTLGKTFTDARLPGVAIAELLIGRPLRLGESAIMEYEVEFPAPYAADRRWEKWLYRSVREYVLEVVFAPTCLPARCLQYRVSDTETDEVSERAVALDAHARVSAVALDVGPGRFGIRWEWPDQVSDEER